MGIKVSCCCPVNCICSNLRVLIEGLEPAISHESHASVVKLGIN